MCYKGKQNRRNIKKYDGKSGYMVRKGINYLNRIEMNSMKNEKLS